MGWRLQVGTVVRFDGKVPRNGTYPANQQLLTHCLILLAGRCARRREIPAQQPTTSRSANRSQLLDRNHQTARPTDIGTARNPDAPASSWYSAS